MRQTNWSVTGWKNNNTSNFHKENSRRHSMDQRSKYHSRHSRIYEKNPKFLGVPLDLFLTLNIHPNNIKNKLQARNTVIKTLDDRTWGKDKEIRSKRDTAPSRLWHSIFLNVIIRNTTSLTRIPAPHRDIRKSEINKYHNLTNHTATTAIHISVVEETLDSY